MLLHMHATQSPSPLQFLRARVLAARWGCHQTTVWRLVKRGELPAPTRISPGVVGWRSDVIERIEAERTSHEAGDRGGR